MQNSSVSGFLYPKKAAGWAVFTAIPPWAKSKIISPMQGYFTRPSMWNRIPFNRSPITRSTEKENTAPFVISKFLAVYIHHGDYENHCRALSKKGVQFDSWGCIRQKALNRRMGWTPRFTPSTLALSTKHSLCCLTLSIALRTQPPFRMIGTGELTRLTLAKSNCRGLLNPTTSVHNLDLASPHSHPRWGLGTPWLLGEV